MSESIHQEFLVKKLQVPLLLIDILLGRVKSATIVGALGYNTRVLRRNRI